MKRKTVQIGIAVFITGVMFFFYSIYSSYFGAFYIMTDEQYAREAQNIVNASHPPCQLATGTAK